MRFKVAAFMFVLSVGAWGQTQTFHGCTIPVTVENVGSKILVQCEEGSLDLVVDNATWDNVPAPHAIAAPAKPKIKKSIPCDPCQWPPTCVADKDYVCQHPSNCWGDCDKVAPESDWLPYLSDQNGNPLPPEVKKKKPSPVDVPAVQELRCRYTQVRAKNDKCLYWETLWTCTDKSRTLMETLDGKTHYCHKPQLTER